MKCIHCGRQVEQQEDKAIGEVGDDRFQVVWADFDGEWVCPITKDEHEPGQATNWWHAFGQDLHGMAVTIIVGPTPVGPDECDLKGTPVKEATFDGATYITSFDHYPTEDEKFDLEDQILETA